MLIAIRYRSNCANTIILNGQAYTRVILIKIRLVDLQTMDGSRDLEVRLASGRHHHHHHQW